MWVLWALTWGGGKCLPYVRKLPQQLRYHFTLEALQGLNVPHVFAMYFAISMINVYTQH